MGAPIGEGGVLSFEVRESERVVARGDRLHATLRHVLDTRYAVPLKDGTLGGSICGLAHNPYSQSGVDAVTPGCLVIRRL